MTADGTPGRGADGVGTRRRPNHTEAARVVQLADRMQRSVRAGSGVAGGPRSVDTDHSPARRPGSGLNPDWPSGDDRSDPPESVGATHGAGAPESGRRGGLYGRAG